MTTPALKYSVQDRSILLPHYKRFLVEPLLPFIPARVNPNAITHGGHVLNLGALLLLVLTAHMDKRWPFVAAAVLVHVYLWCDNADGGHARRTNQCSAKGEFLDHGLDLLNATYVACMTVVTLGAPPFWSVAAAVVVPAAAAVTYWEQAETGVFQLGLFNQIESIVALSVALVARAVFGAEAIAAVEVLGVSLPVVVLAVVSVVALFGIVRSTIRVAQNRGRLGPAVAPYAFGAAVTVVAATDALGTIAAIVAGAVVFIFLGIRQLTLRVRGERPLLERGVLLAAAVLGGLAGYRVLGGAPNAAIAQSIDWAAAGVVSVAFGGLALARALEGHREVERLDRR
ncbi:MAG: CDP-alcohol phosphatidyltransferase family protein [Labilithrix sp.]|nr:CDP-alcohol phosphatidyltransferase family protein [Labilithrix sp.]